MKAFFICVLLFQIVYGTLCPDRVHKCPSWGTCCENVDLKSYGCCPYKNADCCADHIHCCPSGTHCNITNGSCDHNKDPSRSFLWMVPHYHPDTLSDEAFEDLHLESHVTQNKNDEKTLFADLEDNTCPDNSSCPDSATCCKALQNKWSCCPFEDATCCQDEIHCCPNGFKCDLKNRRCAKKIEELHINLEKTLSREEMDNNNKTLSTDVCGLLNICSLFGQICCKYENSEYCCPEGSICGQGGKKCLQDNQYNKSSFFPAGEETTVRKVLEESLVVCPDKTEACLSDQTCCKKYSGDYGCCDQPVATCCIDGLSCCPNGYVCVKAGCERLPSFSLFHLPIFTKKIKLN